MLVEVLMLHLLSNIYKEILGFLNGGLCHELLIS